MRQSGTREPIEILVASSVLFLSIPLAIFFLGYLRWCVGLPLAALLLARLARLCFEAPRADSESPPVPRSALLLALTLALAWLAFSGIGGVGYQRWDFIKHNAVLKTLMDCAWPVRWTDPPYCFVYYCAWYLPAALVGKVFGWAAAQVALILWSLLGLVLTLLWVQQLVRRWSWTLPVLFVFASGLDIIGYLLLHRHLPHGGEIEWWSHYWGRKSDFYFVAQYSGNTSLLYYVPNQAIAGWLATALVLHTIYTRTYGEYLPICFLALLLWSPFAAVGLIPFGLVAARRLRVKDYCSASNIVLVPAAGVILSLYYLSRAFPIREDGQCSTTSRRESYPSCCSSRSRSASMLFVWQCGFGSALRSTNSWRRSQSFSWSSVLFTVMVTITTG